MMMISYENARQSGLAACGASLSSPGTLVLSALIGAEAISKVNRHLTAGATPSPLTKSDACCQYRTWLVAFVDADNTCVFICCRDSVAVLCDPQGAFGAA